jgi:hypothetical protein
VSCSHNLESMLCPRLSRWRNGNSRVTRGPNRILGRIAGMPESEPDMLIEDGEAAPVLQKFVDPARD